MPVDLLIQDLSISGAFLDKNGRIIAVSEQWKKFARAGDLMLDNFGVGEDYLKYAVFSDPSSITTLRGLQSLLKKEVDVFSTVYACDTPAEQRWFLLLGLGVDDASDAAAALLHIDISHLKKNKAAISASMVGSGAGADDPGIEKLTRVIRQTIAASLQNYTSNGKDRAEPGEQKLIRSLTVHQLSLLAHLARGATNSEIAKAHNISVGSAKNQTAALLRRLGVANRTQAALLAVRNGLLDGGR